MHLFSGTGARVDKQLWNTAIDTRDRNWRTFRAVFADHDLIVTDKGANSVVLFHLPP